MQLTVARIPARPRTQRRLTELMELTMPRAVFLLSQYRDVWPIRGELAKQATAAGSADERSFPGSALAPQRERRPRRDDDDDDDRRSSHHRTRQRRKSFLDGID